MKTIKYFLLLILVVSFVNACINSQELKWVDIVELDSVIKSNGKKSIVFIYDPDCETCKKIRKRTFGNQQLNTFLSKKFNLAELSIREEREVLLHGQRFNSKKNLKKESYHSLGPALTYETENLITPSFAFLDEEANLIVPIKKEIDAKELELLATFIAEDHYKSRMPIEEYTKSYEYQYVIE